MKKLFALVVGVLLLAGAAVAQDVTSLSPEAEEVQTLIKNGLKENASYISMKALYLPSYEKTALYEANKKNVVLPTVLNGVVGFGVGSFIEGDTSAGIKYAIEDGICASIMVLCIVKSSKALGKASESSSVAGPAGGMAAVGELAGSAAFLGLAGIAGVVDVCFRIGETIHPIRWTSSYNKTLKSSLGVQDEVSFTLLPAFDPVNSEYGFVAKLSF